MTKLFSRLIGSLALLALLAVGFQADASLQNGLSGFGGAPLPRMDSVGNWGSADNGSHSAIDATDGQGGYRFTAPTTGFIDNFRCGIGGASAASQTYVAEIWSDNAGSPLAQIGSDSSTFNSQSTTGERDVSWSSPISVTAGTVYWVIIKTAGTAGDATFQEVTSASASVSGRNTTITSMVVGSGPGGTNDWRLQINY